MLCEIQYNHNGAKTKVLKENDEALNVCKVLFCVPMYSLLRVCKHIIYRIGEYSSMKNIKGYGTERYISFW